MAKYQFTMFAEKYRPISTIVEAETRQDFVLKKAPFVKAIQNLCMKRSWTTKDLAREGYTTWKVRKMEVTE